MSKAVILFTKSQVSIEKYKFVWYNYKKYAKEKVERILRQDTVGNFRR